mgnify:CR=1 FL=1
MSSAAPSASDVRGTLVLRVEFDHEVRFHHNRVWHVAQGGCANECRCHFGVIDFHVIWNVTLGQLSSFQQGNHLLGTVTHFDHVAFFDAVGRNVNLLAVHFNVAVVHELACSKYRGHEFGAVHNSVQPAFQQTNQVFTRIAFYTLGFTVDAAELLFGQVAIVTLELLLGAQLNTKVRNLALTALTVLPGPYSRRFTGDFGRPQMFSPIRRSILCLAAVRFVTAVLLFVAPAGLHGAVKGVVLWPKPDRVPFAGSTNTNEVALI